MTSDNHQIDWIDLKTGYGYYDDNPTRPKWCVPAKSYLTNEDTDSKVEA